MIPLLLICLALSTPAKAAKPTEAHTLAAYDAFNRELLDDSLGIYLRDTSRDPRRVGAIWTQAIYWDMAMNAYKRTHSPKYLALVEKIYDGCGRWYRHYDWHDQDPKYGWFIYDDIMWWVISMGRAYELFGKPEYLALSESGFDRVWSGSPVVGDGGSYDPVRGGMYWRWRPEAPTRIDDGKMACINYPTVIAAMTLYNATGKEEYLDKALKIYAWARENLFDTSAGRVADSRHGDKTPAWKMHLYNQGTCIGAAVMLYKQTGERRYLDDAVLAADYVKNTMCDAKGIFPVEKGEEQGIYAAIFAQYIIRLAEDGGKPEYLPWLYANIDTAWRNRDKSRTLARSDFNRRCNPADTVSCYEASAMPALMLVCPAR